MKKNILIILGIIIVLILIICGIVFYINYNNVSNDKIPVSEAKYSNDTTNNNEIIIIKDGKIQNENLLDTFIENANNKQATTLQIDSISNENTDTITLEYVPAENDENQNDTNLNDNSSTNSIVIINGPNKEFTYKDYQKYYGYYKMTKNGIEEKFDDYHWDIKRKTEGNKVQVIFDAYLLELLEIPVICEYDLDSSSYTKAYDLTYIPRNDNAIKEIAKPNQFENINFSVYTFGGDVTITIEQDMVYSLEDALNEGKITIQSILDQVKLDEKYRICETDYYKDGGSIEYRYKDYTILKFNTLSGIEDLIIGKPGTIINDVEKISYIRED